jgi:uncharacterized protein YkwD
MKRYIAVLMLSCLVLATSFGAAQDKKDKAKKDDLKIVLSKEEQTVLDLTNAERAKEKLPLLTINPKLMKAARAYSEVMAKAGKATHDVDGTKPRDRATKVGYDGEYVGENVGYTIGVSTPTDMVKWWMGSKVHRENILRDVFTEVGLGAVKDKNGNIYYTQMFGAPFKD